MPVNSKLSFFERIKAMESISIPTFSRKCARAPSISIVYNKNGKRFTISKSLAERLALGNTCHIYPTFEDKMIFLSKDALSENAIKLNLNGDDKKISYNSSVVEFVVNEFNLDYTDATSHSFSKITFEKEGNIEIAAIDVSEYVIASSDNEDTLDGDSDGN